MSDEPYVTDEARALLGVESVQTSYPVSARHIREYCSGGDNWRSEYDGKPGEEVVAPPIFFLAASRRIDPIDELQDDGQYRDLTIPGIYGRSVLASWDIEILDVVRVGDILTVSEKVVAINEKQGRAGKLIIVEKEGRHVNQHGTTIGVDLQTIIYM